MGATTFRNSTNAKTAELAFQRLQDNAFYEYGHNGYTGTIAEKPGFTLFTPPEDMSPKEFIWTIINEGEKSDIKEVKEAYELYDDKWANAVCVQTGEDLWTFFGWASA